MYYNRFDANHGWLAKVSYPLAAVFHRSGLRPARVVSNCCADLTDDGSHRGRTSHFQQIVSN
ncbi:hypothetical protein I547_5543 [Mycobacterium kansasii 824]|uniref:Uncharacterized protein n=1 Tax=Mycobacterium kansasii TaxID=1768 RepID=A0A1V3X2A5_MYCKA|nr:hypothetical protein I547_5543 [Mycobacterium kansasii 824]OOK73443.1 hypothetical protein BZL30_4968 [Mycobacterium kansasii]